MCFDHNVKTIIMLCKLEENGKEKCVKYWEPNISDSVMDYLNYSVKYTSEEINDDITIRTCHVLNEDTKVEKEIKQIHYGGWPDHETPENIQNVYGNILFMFNFVDNLIGQNHIDDKNPIVVENPIVVHCSAGVGRTGTFIALYNIYREILHQLSDNKIKQISFSLMNIVRKLKEMRLYMVQTLEQYKFIYTFINRLLQNKNI